MGVVAHSVLGEIENKIDIAVYFYPNAAESDILNIQRSLELMPEVKEVSYISSQKSLDEFKKRHENDAVILSSLEELDSNPLRSVLNIKARDPLNLGIVAEYLKSKNYPIVDKINYFENQVVIDKLSSIIAGVRNSGFGIILVLAFVAVLVAFNTIRIAIWSAREEINIMRLVGATSWFIRGPFLVEGILHGIISGVIASAIFFPVLWFLSPKLFTIIPSIKVYSYFQSNFFQFLLILVGAGISMGAISSFIAIRRYLKA